MSYYECHIGPIVLASPIHLSSDCLSILLLARVGCTTGLFVAACLSAWSVGVLGAAARRSCTYTSKTREKKCKEEKRGFKKLTGCPSILHSTSLTDAFARFFGSMLHAHLGPVCEQLGLCRTAAIPGPAVRGACAPKPGRRRRHRHPVVIRVPAGAALLGAVEAAAAVGHMAQVTE
jgi:hypothetical protein